MSQIYTEEQLFIKILEQLNKIPMDITPNLTSFADKIVAISISYLEKRGLQSEIIKDNGKVYKTMVINGNPYTTALYDAPILPKSENPKTISHTLRFDNIRMDDFEIRLQIGYNSETIHLIIFPNAQAKEFIILAQNHGEYISNVSENCAITINLFGYVAEIKGEFTDGGFKVLGLKILAKNASVKILRAEYVPDNNESWKNHVSIETEDSNMAYDVYPVFNDLGYKVPDFVLCKVLRKNGITKIQSTATDITKLQIGEQTCDIKVSQNNEDELFNIEAVKWQ